MSKDPNYAVKIEQAIAEKYGKDTVVNPNHYGTTKKNNSTLLDLKKLT